MAESKRTRISDPTVMRALAHPARLTVLEELRMRGTGTATELAAACGLTPSATSYHVRALARAGLIGAAANRGDGRERVWQLTEPGGLEVGTGPDREPDAMRAEQELVLVWLARAEARTRNWVMRWPEETQEWYESTRLVDLIVDATPAELAALNNRIIELIEEYGPTGRAGEVPPDARRMVISYRTVPMPESPRS